MAILLRFVRLSSWVALVATLLNPFNLYAARFGPVQVLSHIGQPLKAKIEISGVTADEQGWLALEAAPEHAYENASLRYSRVAQGLQASIQRVPKGTGKVTAWLTTSAPVTDEFIDLLLTLNWSTGRMTEAFTLLIPKREKMVDGDEIAATLDTREFSDAKPNDAMLSPPFSTTTGDATKLNDAASVNKANEASEAVNTNDREDLANKTQDEMPVSSAVAKEPLKKETKPDKNTERDQTGRSTVEKKKTYKVLAGDTLGKIARKIQSDFIEKITLNQLLWALYQGNPHAFSKDNLNLVKTGAILDVPSAEQMTQISKIEARRQVAVQAADFDRYRASLAAVAVPSHGADQARSSSGELSAAMRDHGVDSATDQLRLSGSESQRQEEAKIAEKRAQAEAQERVVQLEKHVADLQKLADLNASVSKAGAAPSSLNASASKAGTAPSSGTPAAGVADIPSIPMVTVEKKPVGPVEYISQKLRTLFSHNPAVPLGILLALLVLGATLLNRRRMGVKPLFPDRVEPTPDNVKKESATSSAEDTKQENTVPLAAQKLFADLNLDLATPPTKNNLVRESSTKNGVLGVTQHTENAQIRLKLAQAYIELDDAKGASKLLEEVLEIGTEEQRKAAQALLSTLK